MESHSDIILDKNGMDGKLVADEFGGVPMVSSSLSETQSGEDSSANLQHLDGIYPWNLFINMSCSSRNWWRRKGGTVVHRETAPMFRHIWLCRWSLIRSETQGGGFRFLVGPLMCFTSFKAKRLALNECIDHITMKRGVVTPRVYEPIFEMVPNF